MADKIMILVFACLAWGGVLGWWLSQRYYTRWSGRHSGFVIGGKQYVFVEKSAHPSNSRTEPRSGGITAERGPEGFGFVAKDELHVQIKGGTTGGELPTRKPPLVYDNENLFFVTAAHADNTRQNDAASEPPPSSQEGPRSPV